MMVVEMEAYAHLVEIDEEKRQLLIYRIRKNGKKQLFTSVDLPSKTFADDEDGFRRFSTYLGENLLVDSPVARKLLGL